MGEFVKLKLSASFDVSDGIEVSTTTISQEVSEVSQPHCQAVQLYRQVTQIPTTKTVFGYDDFVTTVDNTVMVFTPDANGKHIMTYDTGTLLSI